MRNYLLLSVAFLVAAYAPAQRPDFPPRLPIEQVKPSTIDPRIDKTFDAPNAILRPAHLQGAPLALFMPGTHGQPMFNELLLRTIASQGYRVIGLEYPDDPAVSQSCPRNPDPACAANFRAMRLWAEHATNHEEPVKNEAYDSIAGRLVALLRWLDAKYPDEHWAEFIDPKGEPVWSSIVVSGQSQGAGMAAFIARRYKVARVICFSSPLDSYGRGPDQHFAPWLTTPSATPMDRWWATRNSREPFNPMLTKSYPLMGIPDDHIKVLTLDLPPGKDGKADPMLYHGSGIRDPRYIPLWRQMYGNATDVK